MADREQYRIYKADLFEIRNRNELRIIELIPQVLWDYPDFEPETMDISSLRVGIQHSLIGKNDGVSIVIDQSVKAMVEYMDVPLGNIFFLAAHAPARFNTMLDEVLWH